MTRLTKLPPEAEAEAGVGAEDGVSRAEAPGLADEILIDAEVDDPEAGAAPPRARAWLLVLGLFLVAINLRPALSSLSPLLNQVRAGFGLSGAAAGALTTAPVLCLGLFGPAAPVLARRYGSERVILAGLLTLAFGIWLRSAGPVAALFAGTAVAGASIGVIGVLLPGIVKREFPESAGLMTGLYTMALCIGAAAAAGLTVPLEEAMGEGWRPALAFWLVPAIVAAAAWLPQLASAGRRAGHAAFEVRGLWRDPLAWVVTAYMGLQSSLAYSVFGWLPLILQDRGMTPVESGLVLSVSVLCQTATALFLPMLAVGRRDQRAMAAGVMAATLAGLLGCLVAPIATIWLWAAVLGLGQGGAFGLALTLIVLRSRDAHVAAHLSGMAQSIGYTGAALGPLAVGLVHEWTGGWGAVAGLFAAIAVAALIAGLGAGRAAFVEARTRRLA